MDMDEAQQTTLIRHHQRADLVGVHQGQRLGQQRVGGDGARVQGCDLAGFAPGQTFEIAPEVAIGDDAFELIPLDHSGDAETLGAHHHPVRIL